MDDGYAQYQQKQRQRNNPCPTIPVQRHNIGAGGGFNQYVNNS